MKSYCRFSSMNHYSDVYVYIDKNNNWITKVATERQVGGCPDSKIEIVIDKETGLYELRNRERDDWLKSNPLVSINHPLSGATIQDYTAAKCLDTLRHLRKEGFIVPDEAMVGLMWDTNVGHY